MVLRTLSVSLLLAGCLHTAPPQRLAQGAPVTTAMLLDGQDGIAGLPRLVSDQVNDALASRNLEARPVDANGTLGASRTTQQRLSLLSRAGDAPFLLLLETRVTYYDVLQGRFRWVVYARVTVARRDDLIAAASTEFEVPVFLLYEHDREAEALQAAASALADHTGALVDSFFAVQKVSIGGRLGGG